MTESLDSTAYSSLLIEVQGLLEPETRQVGGAESKRVQRHWESGPPNRVGGDAQRPSRRV